MKPKITDIGFYLTKFQTELELSKFKKYTDEIEFKFSNDINDLNKEIDEASHGLSEYEKAELKENLSLDHLDLHDIHKKIHRRSTVVSLYTFLESSLNHICNRLLKKKEYHKKPDKYDGSIIQKAILFLENDVNLDFQDLKLEIEFFNNLNKVRNCIVHNAGNITEFKYREIIEKIATETDFLTLEFEREIIIEHIYILEIIKNIGLFLDNTYNQIY